MAPGRRRLALAALLLVVVVGLWQGWGSRVLGPAHSHSQHGPTRPGDEEQADQDFVWRKMAYRYPVTSFRPLPTAPANALPRVQARFGLERARGKQLRVRRRAAIKAAFAKCWLAYRDHAWLRDEVTPISGRARDTFGGWGATLVDALDALWIMDMRAEFDEAVDAVHRNVSFVTTEADSINVFETTIRFLGGLLSAYDLSRDPRLLSKARDVGDMLYTAFDTPNRLPVTRWDPHAAARGAAQTASSSTLLAELGSLGLEFTRLSLVTGDPKYHDAVERVGELLAASQMSTKLPGLWPILVDAANPDLDAGSDYGIGGMADSAFEYLPKMAALLGQDRGIYHDMYVRFVDASRRHLLFRPMTPSGDDVLFPGMAHARVADGLVSATLEPLTGHLTCFAGGMLALGGRLVSNKTHVDWADKLTRGCVWAYRSFATGVMPETFYLAACPDHSSCPWDEFGWHQAVRDKWPRAADAPAVIREQHLPEGFTAVSDARYILRPEAIESVFIMYRITGDRSWQETAWHMWSSIDSLTRTELANSAVSNVNPKDGEEPTKTDSMESFWLSETLKYFYLIFSEPDLISLDDWVFNTEAHPFKRLKGGR